jgi:hypothetical protein
MKPIVCVALEPFCQAVLAYAIYTQETRQHPKLKTLREGWKNRPAHKKKSTTLHMELS